MTNHLNKNSDIKPQHKITLEDIGYNATFEQYRIQNNLSSFGVGRVTTEHKERYVVKTEHGDREAEIIGNLRFTAASRFDFPAVGDWVAISEYDENKALIHAIYERNTIIKRKAVGKDGEHQIIATNIDTAFIVQAVNRDFNLNRIERYLAICYDSDVKPIIVINKVDLVDEQQTQAIITGIRNRISKVPVIAISNETQLGIDELKSHIVKGKTYCVLGSSGVGKSTLINTLLAKSYLKTGEIGEGTQRGKHVTSHRELVLLQNGGIIIDTPGMREIGISDAGDGVEHTFDTIAKLAESCRFNNCTHIHEKGCAVLEAVKTGEIDEAWYENYLKLIREKEYFESTLFERRKKGKALSKMIKKHKK